MSGVKVGGAWKTPAVTYVKVAGVWKVVAVAYIKVGGAWKVTTLSGAPSVPALSHTAAQQFTITNYDAAHYYEVTNGTRVDNVITAASGNTTVTVKAAYASGATLSAARNGAVQPYTAVQASADVSFVHAGSEHGVNIPGTIGARWLYCREFPWGGECGHQEGWMVKDTSPSGSGYTDQYGEWFKIY